MPKPTRKRNQRAEATYEGRLKVSGNPWQVQTAKARFSEVFRLARTKGPQRITRQGKEGVVMIADEEYEKLVGKSHQPKDLWQFFRESPLVGLELKFERNKDTSRDIEL
jgi:prevent-host-death family protein